MKPARCAIIGPCCPLGRGCAQPPWNLGAANRLPCFSSHAGVHAALCDLGCATLNFKILSHGGEPNNNPAGRIGATINRAPELLHGSDAYTPKIDVWSFACVLAYIAQGQKHQFGSTRDASQVRYEVFDFCRELKGRGVKMFSSSVLSLYGDVGASMLAAMFVEDPEPRASSKDLLRHSYFVHGDPRTCAHTVGKGEIEGETFDLAFDLTFYAIKGEIIGEISPLISPLMPDPTFDLTFDAGSHL
jgi:serine/threonine protein kinase